MLRVRFKENSQKNTNQQLALDDSDEILFLVKRTVKKVEKAAVISYSIAGFDAHYHNKTAEQTMQFLLLWRNSAVPQRVGVHHFYLNLFKAYKEMREDVYQLLKKEYLKSYKNSHLYFINLLILAGMSKTRISEVLQEWNNLVRPKDLAASVRLYAGLIASPTKETRLDFDAVTLKKFLTFDENMGSYFYTQLKKLNQPKEAYFLYLQFWLEAFTLPHDFSLVKALYLQLIKTDSANMHPNEEKILEILIQAESINGAQIFNYLLMNGASKIKLLRYIDIWMNVLPSDEEIRAAYSQVKTLIQYSAVKDFRFSIRTIGEINTVKLVLDRHTIKNENATLKWLNHTRPGFFGITCSNTHSAYDSYKALRRNEQTGKVRFKHEKERAEKEINQQLRAAGETDSFCFRK